RAILSWQMIPTAGDAGFNPIWGNHMDCHVQIRPRFIIFSEIAATLSDLVQKVIPPEQLSSIVKMPIPLPDPPPLQLAELAKLYAAGPAGTAAAAVPSHRFGFSELVEAVQAPVASSDAVASGIAKWKSVSLDWQAAIAALAEVNANVSF